METVNNATEQSRKGGESQVPEVEREKEMVKKRVVKEGPVLGETWRKVLSWNLNGVRSRLADGSFWRAIEGYDILCLSEFRCPRKTFFCGNKMCVASSRKWVIGIGESM